MATKGTIKRLVRDKGFGFVQAEDGNEYFFHQASCVDGDFDNFREGQALTFDTGRAEGSAENVRWPDRQPPVVESQPSRPAV